jgi:acetate kinase
MNALPYQEKYIGSMQVLNGLDAIVFTAGIGETSHIRKCTDMEYFELY